MVRHGWGRIIGSGLVLFLVGMIPVAVGWGSMPDPFASHWGFNGAPDAHMPLWALPLLHLAIIGLGLLIAGLFHGRSGPSAEGLGFLWALGVLGVVLTTSTVILNRDAVTWDQAATMPWTHIVAALGLSALAGFVGYKVGLKWFPLEMSAEGSDRPIVEVAEGEVVAWTGVCHVRYPYVIAGMATLFAVFLPDPFRWFALPFLVVAIFLSHVRVVVNERGLRARLGGVISKRITLAEMASVNVIDLEPNEWGGWGYRMASGRSAIVLRRGPAIEVSLHTGRKFAVTVDDAVTGAGLLNGLLARRAG